MNDFFKNIPPIKYEGPNSDNPLAFKYYNPDERIGNKTMKEHLNFAVAYWQTFTEDGSDPFGMPTMKRSWNEINDPMNKSKERLKAAFEFFEKLNVPYFCFHDRDIAPRGNSLKDTNRNLDEIVELMEQLINETGVNLLWGTANLFSHPRYMNGAFTSPNPKIFAHAAAQVKKAMEITKKLEGENFVFWGGREGYETLLNTNMKFEQENLARFLHMAVDYANKIDFEGQLLIEPKPKEPTKHQYDFDVANVMAFLQKYDLLDHFKINIEANHATLAGHNFQHELQYARINNLLGSIDANKGDLLLGWDTDQFPTNIYSTTLAMYEVLKNGGLGSGGLNFDAKVRRPSFEPEDLFYGHIAGMDTFARGLKVAHKLLSEKEIENFIEERYSKYQYGIGEKIVKENINLEELEKYALNNGQIEYTSGRQEMLEAKLNKYILGV